MFALGGVTKGPIHGETMKLNTLILLTSALAAISASAEIRTITLDTTISTNSEVLTLSSNSYAVLKSSLATSSRTTLNFGIHGVTFYGYTLSTISSLGPLIFTGPATIYISGDAGPAAAFATFDVEPGPFPPGKTVTIGAYSGNVQVTMEMSTDLVNWTPAVNGMVYTNSPDARFFRIKMVTNATP